MRWRASTSEAPADIIGHEANVTSKLCEACTPYIATASALRRGGVFGRFLHSISRTSGKLGSLQDNTGGES